jgi:hypothetical protein
MHGPLPTTEDMPFLRHHRGAVEARGSFFIALLTAMAAIGGGSSFLGRVAWGDCLLSV